MHIGCSMLVLYSMKPGYCHLCDGLTDLFIRYNLPHEKKVLGVDFDQQWWISKFGRKKGLPLVTYNGKDLGEIKEIINFITNNLLNEKQKN